MGANDWLKTPYDLAGKKIWIAGHTGMVGQTIHRALLYESCEILTVLRDELDLRDQTATANWIAENKPDIIILAAATVGGIGANAAHPAEFLHDNLMIETNVIHAAYINKVEKLLFLGSSCIYPRNADHPITETALLSGPLETTNEAYAIAKIAGIKLCQTYRKQYGCDFIAAMPCNLYGPGDHFNENTSHVIPALILKAHQARLENSEQLIIWGTGTPLREFLYVEDLAEALIHTLKHYSSEDIINIGSGQEVSIAELSQKIADIAGYHGPIIFDSSKPDGTPRKIMDSSKIMQAGWHPKISLDKGLTLTYDAFIKNHKTKTHAT